MPTSPHIHRFRRCTYAALARAQREAARLRTEAGALESAVAAYYFDHRHEPEEGECAAPPVAAPPHAVVTLDRPPPPVTRGTSVVYRYTGGG